MIKVKTRLFVASAQADGPDVWRQLQQLFDSNQDGRGGGGGGHGACSSKGHKMPNKSGSGRKRKDSSQSSKTATK
jgi:hypothetical protein